MAFSSSPNPPPGALSSSGDTPGDKSAPAHAVAAVQAALATAAASRSAGGLTSQPTPRSNCSATPSSSNFSPAASSFNFSAAISSSAFPQAPPPASNFSPPPPPDSKFSPAPPSNFSSKPRVSNFSSGPLSNFSSAPTSNFSPGHPSNFSPAPPVFPSPAPEPPAAAKQQEAEEEEIQASVFAAAAAAQRERAKEGRPPVGGSSLSNAAAAQDAHASIAAIAAGALGSRTAVRDISRPEISSSVSSAAKVLSAAAPTKREKTASGAAAPRRQEPAEVNVEPVNSTDELGRKVWDKAYYQSLAQAKEEEDDFLSYLPQPRQKKVAPPVEHRKALQRRDFAIDLTKELGKTKIVTLQTPRMQQGGFWCDVCECLIKDSAAYMDHINGRNHNRMLGMTMRVERAAPSSVISRLREMQRQSQLELGGDDEGEAGSLSGDVKSQQSFDAPGAAQRGSVTRAAAASAGCAPGGIEENYDDIDRIKRRLEELQKQEEERKMRKKLKKKKGASEDAEKSVVKNGEAGGGAAPAEGVNQESDDEEQKMLKAMGLPSSFVGS
ncbi:putative zinc finger protein [Toxoplasma gondii ARI]|uniref:Putative zinc finger protein n=2 Tax=Toxoplasma gondii TaxID=5811 RepID=A0A139XVG2_TOXGO|nr:putative zinc finger protein [Toxoplasma gondii ARI]